MSIYGHTVDKYAMCTHIIINLLKHHNLSSNNCIQSKSCIYCFIIYTIIDYCRFVYNILWCFRRHYTSCPQSSNIILLYIVLRFNLYGDNNDVKRSCNQQCIIFCYWNNVVFENLSIIIVARRTTNNDNNNMRRIGIE